MPRANERFMGEAAKSAVSPVLLVRILRMPEVLNPAVVHDLYLTDCDYDPVTLSGSDVWFYDESGAPCLYLSCGCKFEQVSVSKENEIATASLSIDNVSRTFAALAQHVDLERAEVQVLRGFRELLGYPDGAQTLFVGRLRKPVVNEASIKSDVWADFTLKLKITRRMYWTNLFPYLPASKDVRETLRA